MSLINILRSGRIVLHIVSGQLGVRVGSFRVGGFITVGLIYDIR